MVEAVTVIYIAGWGRSGSTLLDNLLGSQPGLVSCGELRYFLTRGMEENRLCADGVAMRDHPFWRQVSAAAFTSTDSLEAMRRVEHAALYPLTMLPRLAFGFPPGLPPGSGYERYVAFLGRLYRAIADASGGGAIVDSSKNPVYAYWLSHVPGIRLRVIHLMRDPRAVAFSWLRHKAQPDKGAGGTLARHGTLRSTVQWRLANAAAERIALRRPGDYVRLSYETFMRTPRASLDRIADTFGLSSRAWPFDDQGRVSLAPGIGFSGNPSRFHTGPIALKLDDEWRRALSPWRRELVERLAGPALHRYGYS